MALECASIGRFPDRRLLGSLPEDVIPGAHEPCPIAISASSTDTLSSRVLRTTIAARKVRLRAPRNKSFMFIIAIRVAKGPIQNIL